MEQVKSICGLCNCECGIIATVAKGRLESLAGDPDCALNRGALCSKATALKQLAYDPDRVTSPMKKTRQGRWQSIDWDTALGEIAEKINRLQQQFGPACTAFYQGTLSKINTSWISKDFLYGIHSPNYTSVYSLCVSPREISSRSVFGHDMTPICDYSKAKYILLMGANPAVSGMHRYLRVMDDILTARENGSRLVVVDPRCTETAQKADLWVPIKPATDLAFTLGMIHIIIAEKLYDDYFVTRHCSGFEKLRKTASAYPPDRVSAATGIAEDTIFNVARGYATQGPSCVDRREGVMHQQNATQINSAILALAAICGNVDVPWGFFFNPGLKLSPTRSCPAEPPHFCQGKYSFANAAAELPEAILAATPYPVKSLITVMGNPVTAWPNTKKVLAALEQLELLICIDLYFNETVQAGHYFLPGVTCLERYTLSCSKQMPINLIRLGQPVISPVGNSRPEDEIICDLGRQMRIRGYQDLKSSLDVIDKMLIPSGFTAAELLDSPEGFIHGKTSPGGYLENGFPTESGRIELSQPETLSQVPDIQSAKENTKHRFPYALIAGFRLPMHYHASLMNLPQTREHYPIHQAEISEDVAREKKIQDGDRIQVTTEQGSLELPAQVMKEACPGTVAVPHGFGAKYGKTAIATRGENINYLTTDVRDRLSAAPAYREVRCNVVKVPTAHRLRLIEDRCTGCMACVAACNGKQDLPGGISYLHLEKRGAQWEIQVCRQCPEPFCVAACRQGAWEKKDHAFFPVPDRCVYCGDCARVCPYDSIVLDPDRKNVGKCSLCISGEEDSSGTREPACVAACPVSALYVG